MNNELRLGAAKALFTLMINNNIAIKIAASTSLPKILNNKEIKEAFKSELPRILESYITIIENYNIKEIFEGLEEIITIYADSIEPFAIDLCKKLAENFKKIQSKIQNEE
mmetsp:Transcript_1571/g.1380  ORF Transcript_1571/g.1380 Transcript_1571/m.1380 type:complete len:110 (-) Transcript_1571:1077-1406(-)